MKIRFVTGNDWISNAIRFGERDGWCTHAEAVLDNGSLLGARLNSGVTIQPPGYDKATMTRELIVDINPSIDMDREKIEKKFYDFLRAQLGKPYDMTAIAGLALDRDWRSRNAWFCSELVAAALEECGYLLPLSSADNHVSPRDLLLVLSGRIPLASAA